MAWLRQRVENICTIVSLSLLRWSTLECYITPIVCTPKTFRATAEFLADAHDHARLLK
jgi:hypothetical protein